MKISNAAINTMLNILNKYGDYKLPSKVSYSIIRNSEILEAENKIYMKQLSKIYEEYVEKDDSGNYMYDTVDENKIPRTKENCQDAFVNEVNELLKITVDISLSFLEKKDVLFDDPNDRFDVLTPRQTCELMSVLCIDEEKEEAEKEKK